jgi:diguanylate cyclase (GGDEF)-like protein
LYYLQRFKEKDFLIQLKESTAFLYRRSIIGIFLTLFTITAFTFFIASDVSYSDKINFWIAVLFVQCIRLIDVGYWFVYQKEKKYQTLLAFFRFASGLVVSAGIWSLYIVLLYDQFDVTTFAIAVIICCGMNTGAIAAVSSSRTLCIAYSSVVMLPICIVAISDTNADMFILGCVGIFYWLTMLLLAHKNSLTVLETLTLKHSNARLVEDIKADRDEIVRINNQLRRSNEALDHANASLEIEVTKRTEDIHRLSNRDPLTSLMNRKGFMRLLNKQISSAQQLNNRFALLFIDLDGFKQVNDSLGHQVGDGVLEEIGRRLARYSDADNLGRWGGDEFVMLLPYANNDTAIAVAHATKSSIALPMEVMSYQISLDATIGISLFPDHSEDAQGLVQLADLTMYDLKKHKPGSFAVFNEKLYTKLQKDLLYRDGLRNAIEQNELSLVYQPIVRSRDNSVWGFEALLRWSFKGETVSPVDFIPLAEKIGLIIDIGTWVLHRACIDASQWVSNEHTVSVNVSVIQVMDDGFIGVLDNVIASSGIDPKRLHLEITESVFADNKEKVRAQIGAIKQRKIQISIDDFGTGYSSLSQLQSLQFDHIKIDRSFVQNLEEGSETIIRATLLMAKEFSCITVAEGIESQSHVDRLNSVGVDLFQGYYFSKPMLNNAIPIWLSKHEKQQK